MKNIQSDINCYSSSYTDYGFLLILIGPYTIVLNYISFKCEDCITCDIIEILIHIYEYTDLILLYIYSELQQCC